ncbi:MAG: FGGY family carbohydrate kinase [Pseudorhodobacter sp.]
MMAEGSDILIGIDAGTSVIKAVAFDLSGRQLAMASVPNRYTTRASDGAAFQPLAQTWDDCAATLRALAEKIENLSGRTAALAVTAQGDGTWLIGAGDVPVDDGWLWLDSRSAKTVARLRGTPADAERYAITGTGLNVCQMGSQLAHMEATEPEKLDRAEVGFHCKDWLYLNLTGVRATDPSEANFTFGNFRTRRYDDRVLEALGLTARRHLLPDILDGTETTHPLTAAAAAATGLRAGTPVSLGYVDVVCTALGAGIMTDTPAACSIIGSTAMHMRALPAEDVPFNGEQTGYVMCLPIPGMATMMQSTMAATLNIDWILGLAEDLLARMGQKVSRADLIAQIDGWMAETAPGALIYHPYISEAGERGPFVDASARASLTGLTMTHRFPDLVRAVVEGLSLAARDCYRAMGPAPEELRLTGGAARSDALRTTLSAAVGTPTRISAREEAGAAGAAMMAAVATGHYPDIRAAIAEWVTPHLGEATPPDPGLATLYADRYETYRKTRLALAPHWGAFAHQTEREQ